MSGMSYRARRIWSIIVLVIGLPLYIIVAVNVVEMFERPSFLVELLIFVVLGIIWMVPLRFVSSRVKYLIIWWPWVGLRWSLFLLKMQS